MWGGNTCVSQASRESKGCESAWMLKKDHFLVCGCHSAVVSQPRLLVTSVKSGCKRKWGCGGTGWRHTVSTMNNLRMSGVDSSATEEFAFGVEEMHNSMVFPFSEGQFWQNLERWLGEWHSPRWEMVGPYPEHDRKWEVGRALDCRGWLGEGHFRTPAWLNRTVGF